MEATAVATASSRCRATAEPETVTSSVHNATDHRRIKTENATEAVRPLTPPSNVALKSMREEQIGRGQR